MADPYASADTAEATPPLDAVAEPVNDNAPSAAAPKAAAALMKLIEAPNIATTLEPERLTEIAATVVKEYEIDDASRSDWKERMQAGLDLAMLIAGPEKTYPFDKASNVKYPLVTVAALQFNARAYPAIVPSGDLVKCKVNGKDPRGTKAARAGRVSEYTSYQLSTEMPEWEPDTDRLTVALPIVGTMIRKRYWDPSLNRQVSRLIFPDRFVVNYRARSLNEVPRTTEELTLYPYEIRERILDGRFIEFDYSQAAGAAASGDRDKAPEGSTSDDKDAPQLFLEQHRLLDLDGDDYPEPYIVTVHKESQKVCRIVANYTQDTARFTPDGSKVVSIRKRDFYVDYRFLPNPDGGFYGLGFGWLLKDNNEAINSNLNMLLDAGHMANVQGGFVSSALGIREKTVKLKMGDWRVLNTAADLRSSIMPVTYPGPSETLFKLLGLLIEMGKEVASIKDVLSGEVKQNMQPTTVLALIDQGMQFFTAIYKRIHRTVKDELAIHCRLNFENLSAEDYNKFFDDQQQQYDPKADFDGADEDVTPASDPQASSKMQKLAKAEFLKQWATGNPRADQEEVDRRYLAAADIEEPDKLFAKPTPPDPLMVLLGELEAQEKMAGITDKLTAAIKNIADAEAAEAGQQLAQYDQFLNYLNAEHGMEMDHANAAQGGPGGLPGMEGPGNDPMGAGPTPGDSGGAGAGGQGAPVPLSPPPGQPGPDMGVPAA